MPSLLMEVLGHDLTYATLLLSARQTDDSQKLWRARIAEKCDVVRVRGWLGLA